MNSLSFWSFSGFISCLLLFKVLRENLFVWFSCFSASLPSLFLSLLHNSLSSQSSGSNESLDVWSFVSSLLSNFDFSSNNEFGWVILLSECENFSDAADSLWSKSSWSFGISESWNFSISLNENLKSNNGKIWSTDATSGWLSLSLTCSSWSVESCSCM